MMAFIDKNEIENVLLYTAKCFSHILICGADAIRRTHHYVIFEALLPLTLGR